MFTKMDKRLKYGLILGVILALIVATGALAAVWTDKEDYAPGETVTISGDNSNDAGYVPGNSVTVNISGPNGWSSSCSAAVGEEGSWSCTITIDSDPAIAVGDYTYTATSIDVNGNPINESGAFTDANPQQVDVANPISVIVTQGGTAVYGDVTVTMGGNTSACTLTFGTTAISPGATAVFSGDNPVTVSNSNVSKSFSVTTTGSTPTGSHTFHVTVARGSNCQGSENLTSNQELTLTVNTAAVNTTTTASNAAATYGDASVTLSASISPAPSVGTVTFTVKDGSTTIGTAGPANVVSGAANASFDLTGVNAGTYTIEASYSGGTGFNASDNSGQDPAPTLTVNKANPDCSSIAGVTVTYDGSNHGATGSCKGVDGNDLAGLDLGASFTNVPGGTANWTFTDVTGNYNDNSGGSVEIEISKADATCDITGYTGTYDGDPHGATGTCTGVYDEVLAGLDLGASFTNVPGGTANWTFTDVTGNYNNDSGSVEIEIAKADPTCSISGYSVVYDGLVHGATGECTGVMDEELAGLGLGASFTNVPGGTANWIFTDETGNYNDDSGSVEIVITKADATIVVDGYTGVYDGVAHGATGSATGVQGEDLSTGLDLGASFTDVPGGSAYWTFTGGTNYNDANGSVEIVIDKADAICSISGYTGVYDAAFRGASGSCSGIGGEEAGTLELGDSFKDVPGGTAHWVFTGNGNYNDQEGDASIVIDKADATCSISGYTGVYDAAFHGASGSCSGIGGEEAGTLELGDSFKDVPGGTAHWVFTGNGNYNDQEGDASIVITKAMLTVKADDKTKILNAPNPPFTYQITGLVNSEYESVIDTPPTCTSTATQFSPVGSYPITCSGGVDNNYDFDYLAGSLTITYATGGLCYGAPGHAILQPINADGSSVFKQKSTVPAKFRVCDAYGNSIGTPGVVTSFKLVKTVSGIVITPLEDAVISTTPDTEFRWSDTDKQWIFNINTKNLSANKTYYYLITLNDGSTIEFHFGLK